MAVLPIPILFVGFDCLDEIGFIGFEDDYLALQFGDDGLVLYNFL